MPKIPSGVAVEQSSRKHHVAYSLRGVSETSLRTQKCVALNFRQPQPVFSRLDDSNTSLPLGEYDYEEAATDIVSSGNGARTYIASYEAYSYVHDYIAIYILAQAVPIASYRQ